MTTESRTSTSSSRPRSGHYRKAAPEGVVVIGSYVIPKNQAIAASVVGIIIFGLFMGLLLPEHTDDPKPWDRISAVIGWWYFAAWSISFYPQVYLNWVRRSVVGMSFDYQLLNLLGFFCYGAYNVAFYFIDSIKDDYKKHHPNGSIVRANDVAFALHAELLTLVTIFQIFIYERGSQRLSLAALGFTAVAVVVYSTWAICTDEHRCGDGFPFTWLDFFSGLSWVKMFITIVKYIPQVYLNYTRKRTTGWNIWNVLLDFTGGTLSILQALIDCISQNDFSGVIGDPVKFGLGFSSMIFDTIFMVQHYILYKNNNALDLADDDEYVQHDVLVKNIHFRHHDHSENAPLIEQP